MARFTSGTFSLIKAQFYQPEFFEQPIKRPKGTGGSTKWPAGNHTPDDKRDHNNKFIQKEVAQVWPEPRLEKNHGQACFKGASRADIFAEPRGACPKFISNQQGQQHHENKKKAIFAILKN